jgi:2-polyprenyl-3-methyl-5-hydroxy-6-metoxy-1,4-benzoquinol methylase
MNKNNEIITGNYYDKFSSKNIFVRFVINRYLKTLNECISRKKIDNVLDLGCGEGKIVDIILKKYDIKHLTGIDIDDRLLKDLKNKYPKHLKNKYPKHLKNKYPKHTFKKILLDKKFNLNRKYDLVLCLEVLEHIKEYKKVLKNISKIRSNKIIISVPNEPFFRLANISRLKYLKSFGNTPGHINNFSFPKFKKIIQSIFKEKKIKFKICYIWLFAIIE